MTGREDSGETFDRRAWAQDAARRADGTFLRQNFGGRRDPQSRQERRAAVAGLLHEVGSCRRVARLLGVSGATVQKDAHELGLTVREPVGAPTGRRTSAERALRAKELYEQGLSMERVGNELDVSERQVSRYLHRLSVAIRPAGAPAKHPRVGERVCPSCGKRFTPKPALAAVGKYEGCSASCGKKLMVDRAGLPDGFIHPGWEPNKRRKWKGKKSGRKPPSVGARPRGRPATVLEPAEVAKVRKLRREHPEWGERTIARAAKLSRYQVARILSEPEHDEQQEAA